ncbi:MAG: DNA-directed RNA polymerase subunit B, partial [Methanosarcinaceae archaeon]
MSESKIFLNGELIGTHTDPVELVADIRKLRCEGVLSRQVNVTLYEDTHEVIINSDIGRARRPLIIVKNGVPLVTKEHIEKLKNHEIVGDELVNEGLIDFIDAEEEENLFIALYEKDITPDHTHMELNPSMILGICTGAVPYPEHNASPRNTMGAAMVKQCIGVPTANTKLRPDTRAHLLHYPQKALTRTQSSESIHFDDRPAGQNFVVAVLS